MSDSVAIRAILKNRPGVVNTAGSVLVSWMLVQMGYRDWVREIEPDMLYHDPEGIR